MRIGTGIVLLVIGAVLTFAVSAQFEGIDLAIVGWILMVAGALAIVVELAVLAPRRRRTVRTDGYEGGPVRRSTTEETY